MDNTASFVVRFTQNLFQSEEGETEVQWRGKITHVQNDEQVNFSEMEDAIKFMQAKLSELTLSSIEGKTEDEQRGILSKSYDIWKRMAKSYPKMVMDVIKDPKAQVTQIQEQITQVGDELTSKIELDSWRPPSKADFLKLTEELKSVNKKIDDIAAKLK